MDSSLMVVLQQTAKHRVVARSQAGKSPIAKSVNLHRQNPAGEREHTEGSPIEKEVDTILGGPCKAKKSCYTHNKYAQEVRYPPQVAVYSTNGCSSGGIAPKPNDVVFTEVDTN